MQNLVYWARSKLKKKNKPRAWKTCSELNQSRAGLEELGWFQSTPLLVAPSPWRSLDPTSPSARSHSWEQLPQPHPPHTRKVQALVWQNQQGCVLL